MVEPGTAIETSPDDLLVEATAAGLTVRPATGGTITTDQPIALLRGAGGALAVVQALLDRCAAAEAHS